MICLKFLCGQGAVLGRTDGRLFTVLASLQRGAAVVASRSTERCTGLAWTELAHPPEHWPAASTCDAAAVITREPNFWLVLLICQML